MIHASNFTVILDACVLYPAPIRDLLLSFADADFFRPQWTREIESEWTRNLLENRPDLENALPKTVQQMALAFPDAYVTGYESLIASVELPDPNDRHVVAAAIKAGAEIIVTVNLRDFPAAQLQQLGIVAQHPDVFISTLIDFDEGRAVECFRNMVGRLNKPRLSEVEVLKTLANNQEMHETWNKLGAHFV